METLEAVIYIRSLGIYKRSVFVNI
jgi:hypothetical protein